MELNHNLANLKKEWRNYYITKRRREMTPPIFFHEKAIKFCDRNDFLSNNHIEYIYATLVSWGMNRAGEKGAKMPTYEIFKESILRNEECIRKWKDYKIETISEAKLKEILPCLTCLCFNIQATKCHSKLVSSSKTLSHILPNMVCPIDNRYTLTFFKDDMKGKNEMEKFKYIISQMWLFFHNNEITTTVTLKGTFAHSLPKIFDNLVMEYVNQNNLIPNNNSKAQEAL